MLYRSPLCDCTLPGVLSRGICKHVSFNLSNVVYCQRVWVAWPRTQVRVLVKLRQADDSYVTMATAGRRQQTCTPLSSISGGRVHVWQTSGRYYGLKVVHAFILKQININVSNPSYRMFWLTLATDKHGDWLVDCNLGGEKHK